MTHRRFPLISLGMTVAVFGAFLSSCKDSNAPSTPGHGASMATVQVAPLVHQNVDVEDEWYGYLRGVEDAAVRPQVTGVLVEKCYRDGSQVKKGEPLFQIDKALFQATLDQAKATLAQAKAAKAQAQASVGKNRQDVDRYSKLAATGSVSEKSLTDAQQALKESEAQVYQAEAQIQMAEAQIESARINLEYTTIKAPISGVAGVSAPSVGDLLSPTNADPLVTVSSIDPIRVDFAVNEKTVLDSLHKYKQGDHKMDVIPKFNLILADGKAYGELGGVVALDRAVDRGSSTINVVGHVPNPDLQLRPGMAVRVRAVTNTIENATLVPERAIVSVQSANFVILIGEKNVPMMVPVAKGPVTKVQVKLPDGGETVQPMRVVTFLQPSPELDKMVASGGEVVVEGTTAAMMAAQMHAAVKSVPYVYIAAQPTIASKTTMVTDEKSGAPEKSTVAPAAQDTPKQ